MVFLKDQEIKLLYDAKVSKENKIKLEELQEGEKISIVSDTMFKTMFQNENRIKYSCLFLSYFLDVSYEELLKNLQLRKNELDKKMVKDKGRRCDYTATIRDTTINIEVNNNSDLSTMERNMEYAHRFFAKKIERGKSEDEYTQVIQININNFSFEGNDKIVDTYYIQNDERIKLHNKLIFVQIYLPNLRKKWYTLGSEALSEMEKYLLVLAEPKITDAKALGKGEKIMEEYIEEAESVCLEEDLLESYDKELAFKEECYKEGLEEGIEKGFKEGNEKGIKKGFEEGNKKGLKEGIEKGKKQRTEEIAKELLKKKMDLNIISESTGLSMDELKKMSMEI